MQTVREQITDLVKQLKSLELVEQPLIDQGMQAFKAVNGSSDLTRLETELMHQQVQTGTWHLIEKHSSFNPKRRRLNVMGKISLAIVELMIALNDNTLNNPPSVHLQQLKETLDVGKCASYIEESTYNRLIEAVANLEKAVFAASRTS